MSALLARLARLLSRRWRFGLLGALLVFVVLVGISAAGNSAADDFSVPGTESQKAYDLLKAHSPTQAGVDSQIVFSAKQGKVTDPGNRATIEATLAKVSALKGATPVPSPFDSPAQSISKDGTIAVATVSYDVEPSAIKPDDGKALIDTVDKAADNASLMGNVRGQVAEAGAQGGGGGGEVVGILLAAILLFFLFRSGAAMAVTLLSAIVGVAFGATLLLAVSDPLGLPEFAMFLAILLGLGAGIDYSLLIVGRFREERASGFTVGDSAAKAAATAGSAVVTAGLIVMVAIAGLLAIGIPFIGLMGVGAAVGIAAVVLSAVTMLPILLGAFKRWLRPKKAVHVSASPGFTRWGRTVTARPYVSIISGVVFLLLLASPALHLRIGLPDDSTRASDDPMRVAYDQLGKAFGVGSNGPFLIVADIKKGDAAATSQLATLQQQVGATPGIAAAVPAQLSKDGEIATMIAIPKYGPQDERTTAALERLRDDTIPAATKGTGLQAYVGGQTATMEDLSSKTASGLPIFIAVVIGLSVLLLMAAFRSLWIPLVSAVFNLLSVGAAYGIVVAVFQDGIGSSLIGAGDGNLPIAFFVPVMLFAILFGLSMDYNVFLLSRIHEAHKEGDGPRDAVIHGMGRIGKVILFAGLIMASVFIAFTSAPDVGQKMIGIGLGLAILLDVLVVRLVIAPAVVLVLGEHAWTLPKWLDRLLPNVSLEGHLVQSQEPREEPLEGIVVGDDEVVHHDVVDEDRHAVTAG